MPEDPALERWLRLEAHKLNESVVAQPRLLVELLRDAEPRAATRGGALHAFDRAAVRALGEALSPLARHRLRLPLTFFLDHEAPGDAYALGDDAIEALQELKATANRPRDGKLWLSTPLALDVARRFPTCIQFVRG